MKNSLKATQTLGLATTIARLTIAVMLSSCAQTTNTSSALPSILLQSSRPVARANSETYGTGYVSVALLVVGKHSVKDEACRPGCDGGVVYGKEELEDHDQNQINSGDGFAKYDFYVTSSMGTGSVSNTVGAKNPPSKPLATAGNAVSTTYIDEIHISSNTLKKGTKVFIQETLEVTPEKVSVNCAPSQPNEANVVINVAVGSKGNNSLNVSGTCYEGGFEWYVNNKLKDKGTKVTKKIFSLVGEGGSLTGSNNTYAAAVQGSTILGESDCFTLRSLTKGATIEADSGHDYSKCS